MRTETLVKQSECKVLLILWSFPQSFADVLHMPNSTAIFFSVLLSSSSPKVYVSIIEKQALLFCSDISSITKYLTKSHRNKNNINPSESKPITLCVSKSVTHNGRETYPAGCVHHPDNLKQRAAQAVRQRSVQRACPKFWSDWPCLCYPKDMLKSGFIGTSFISASSRPK